jgi:hypothetical protein
MGDYWTKWEIETILDLFFTDNFSILEKLK